MNKWKKEKLSFFIKLFNGKTRPKTKGLVPVFGGNGIIEFSDEYNYDNENIIIGRVGAYCGNVNYYNGKVWISDNAINIKSIPNISFGKFIYYLLINLELRNLRIGSSQPLITQSILKNICVTIPPFNEQKSIARVLSSFDDKIEVNKKINKKLEELVELLYKHWFVDFEFPDQNGNPYKSSGGKMVNSELGLIPLGWKIEKLGNSSISMIIKSGIEDFTNQKKYLATADVTDTTITNHQTNITLDYKPSRANMQPKNNTVWFAKMKASRKLIRVSSESVNLINNYIFSTGFSGIECKDSLNYVWSFISSKEFDELKNSLATGTTQEAINNGVINNMNFLVPSKDVLEKFEKLVNGFYNKKELNDNENIKLTEMRDLLLPKLMSGEIRLPVEE